MKRNILNLAIFVAINIIMAATSLAIAKEISYRDSIPSKYKTKGRN